MLLEALKQYSCLIFDKPLERKFRGNQVPVVQSVVSFMGSLRVISLTVLVDSIYIILIFFAEKCE